MRIFVDQDGVLADFDGHMRRSGLTSDEIKRLPGAYLAMAPIPGAIEGVKRLISKGHDVWVATKPPTAIPHAYADKVAWILKHLPELKRKIVLTHDKSLLRGDLLIDDRPHRARAFRFEGHTIIFGGRIGWLETLRLVDDVASLLKTRV